MSKKLSEQLRGMEEYYAEKARWEKRRKIVERSLLPCPFCGGTGEIVRTHHGTDWVSCQDCGAQSPDPLERPSSPAAAKRAWNRRKVIIDLETNGFDKSVIVRTT